MTTRTTKKGRFSALALQGRTAIITGAGRNIGKAIALKLAAHGITANTITPGPTQTKRILENYPGIEERERYWVSQMPLGRLGRVDDVANTCAFLASDAAEYVTGQLIHLSGGWVMS